MHPSRVRSGRRAALLAGLALIAGCTAGRPVDTGTKPAAPVTAAATTTTAAGPVAGTFVLSGAQAEQVATVVAFPRAYNAGRLQAALALFTDHAVVSDCDYRQVKNTDFAGRAGIADWLRQRIADHDQLTVARISAENPDDPVGAVGVEYQRRASDTLRALGFPDGIKPASATKVVLGRDHRIVRFANGPLGGSARQCRPGPG